MSNPYGGNQNPSGHDPNYQPPPYTSRQPQNSGPYSSVPAQTSYSAQSGHPRQSYQNQPHVDSQQSAIAAASSNQPSVSSYLEPEPASKLGFVAIGLAAFTLLAGILIAIWSAGTTEAYFKLIGWKPGMHDTSPKTPEQTRLVTKLGWSYMTQLIPTILGILGIIFGGFAAKNKSSRLLGIISIVACVLAPVVIFIIFVAATSKGFA